MHTNMLSSTCNSSHHQRKRYGYQRYPVKISKFIKVFSPKKTKQFQKWCLHHFSLCFLRGQKHVQNQRSEKISRFPPEYPSNDLNQPTDEEFTTNPADQINKNSSFLQCENERIPNPRTTSQLYLEAEALEHELRALNNQRIPRNSLQSKPAITPASPFAKGDSRNEPIRQNGPLNSVMSQKTQSPAFVNQLQLLEQHIAELEWRGSFMSQDLKKTQFEMLELRDALQASNEIIKKLEEILGDETLYRREAKSHQVDDKANPYRMEKDNGIRSSPRPVLTAVTGFPPPTPQQFQERIWPTEKRFENVEIFTQTPVPEDGIPPSVKKANPYQLEKDNGIRSSPRPVLTAVTGFPPPTPQQFQERIWPTEKRFENVEIFTQTPVPEDGIPPSVKKANPYRLENDNGIRSSPRPVLTAVTGFPPPTPQQFQERSRKRYRGNLYPNSCENPYRLENDNGIRSSPRPVLTAVTGFPPPTPQQFQERIWPTEKRFENVEIFTQTPVPEDGIPPSVKKANPYRLENDNGIRSSPRPVLTAVTGFPPPTPQQFQERIWPTEKRFENVEIFTQTPVPEDGIPPSVKKANPYRLEKDNGIRSSPRPVLTTVTGFPPPTPQQFQERIWPTEKRFQNV
ncbi:hypothetical protein OUZ56_030179 [Daphnia magna]|uniref:Uncharacterized protein n=1 Tax=Daphnia magna TaxID=35525 RepID=A0ABQ9ZQK5_9CRUS|nr:hypothetical protein OUZ56_030179 [Daphnia magna]